MATRSATEDLLERRARQLLYRRRRAQDADGYFWLMGRVDDVINVSGHRLGTMEVESALVAHPKVAEAAVVGRPDELKGQAISAFVSLESGNQPSEALKDELRKWVSKEIGSLARPDDIRFTEALPKTRSGKIMRRLLQRTGHAWRDQGRHDDAGRLHRHRQAARGGRRVRHLRYGRRSLFARRRFGASNPSAGKKRKGEAHGARGSNGRGRSVAFGC